MPKLGGLNVHIGRKRVRKSVEKKEEEKEEEKDVEEKDVEEKDVEENIVKEKKEEIQNQEENKEEIKQAEKKEQGKEINEEMKKGWRGPQWKRAQKRVQKRAARKIKVGGKRVVLPRPTSTGLSGLIKGIKPLLEMEYEYKPPTNAPQELLDRKARSEKILRELNIEYFPHLPLVGQGVLRSPQQVLNRLVILSMVNDLAFCPDHPLAVAFGQKLVFMLKKTFKIWKEVSPKEKDYLLNPTKSDRVRFSMQYRAEARWVLYWAFNIISKDIGIPNKMIKLDDVGIDLMELYEPMTYAAFKLLCVSRTGNPKAGTLRSLSEIEDKQDLVYRTHWAYRNKMFQPHTEEDEMRDMLAIEWHQTLGWLTSGSDWDEVDLST